MGQPVMISTSRRSQTVRQTLEARRVLAFAILLLYSQAVLAGSAGVPPEKVTVQPVILVPRGESLPNPQMMALFQRHVAWAQEFYNEALPGESSFALSPERPVVVRLRSSLAYYKALPSGEAATAWTAELLSRFETDRFTCPYVFLSLVANSRDYWPPGGGRPINGGLDRGAGYMHFSLYELAKTDSSVQSTIRHELGHAFGLHHVDKYGYSQSETPSVMAYYQPFSTKGLSASAQTPLFIPEDLRGLMLNPQAFPGLKVTPAELRPVGYTLCPTVPVFPPMILQDHPDYEPVFQTNSGEDRNSSVTGINTTDILPCVGPGVNFDRRFMWLSNVSPTGQVDLEVEFPIPVTLDSITFHTGHGTGLNQAHGVKIERLNGTTSTAVTTAKLDSPDTSVVFSPTTGSKWRFQFAVTAGRKLCFRGVEFFNAQDPVFPPRVPYGWRQRLALNDLPIFPVK